MADSKSDTRRNSHKTSLTFTDVQAAPFSNLDLERQIRGTALVLSGVALASKSINDLRFLASVKAGDS